MSNFVRICVSSLARPVVAPGTCRVSSRALQPLATNKALVTWVDRLKRKRSGVQSDPASEQKSAEGGGEGQKILADSEPVKSSEEAAAVPDATELLKEKEELLRQQDEKMKELQDKFLRALAEVENTRQRMAKQVEDARLFGIQGFSRDILDVADILEKATESVPAAELQEGVNPALASLYEGLIMTGEQLQKVFNKNGLKRIEPLGDKFDPSLHEALFEVPGDKPGTVAVVSKVGYLLNGRTIRPALVGVAKATKMENKEEEDP